MRPPLSFFVAGDAKPAGSKRGFYIKSIKRVVITDANPNSRDWKTDVKHAAQAYLISIGKGTGGYNLWDCPISLKLVFTRLRPKSHYRSGKNSSLLKEGAPARPISKPDALKLARGVEDALTGIVWVDDAQIVDEHLHKHYGPLPGVLIEIKEAE